MNRTHYRLLGQYDVIMSGDRIYIPEENAWFKVHSSKIGEHWHDGISPTRRKFYLPDGEKPKDVPNDTKPKTKFDFRIQAKDCSVLVKDVGGVIELAFHSKNLSSSKDWIKVYIPPHGQTPDFWMKVDDLNARAIEIL